MTICKFHVCIYADPGGTAPLKRISLAGCEVTPLAADQGALHSAWRCTFDEVYQALEKLPRTLLEPDGSLAWSSPPGAPLWRLEGNLYDRGPTLAYLEIKGSCDERALEQIMQCLGWPQVPLLFQWPQLSILVGENDFRKLVGGG